MAVQHTNYKKVTYTLYEKPTKTGRMRYYFSSKPSGAGTAVSSIPDGYEIYENPNGNVFLSRIKPKFITDAERAAVEQGMKDLSLAKYYKVHAKDKKISIFTPIENVDLILESMQTLSGPLSEEKMERLHYEWRWQPVMHFVLRNEKERLFIAQGHRWRTNEWVPMGKVDKLDILVEAFVPLIDEDSFFTLF